MQLDNYLIITTTADDYKQQLEHIQIHDNGVLTFQGIDILTRKPVAIIKAIIQYGFSIRYLTSNHVVIMLGSREDGNARKIHIYVCKAYSHIFTEWIPIVPNSKTILMSRNVTLICKA